MNLYLHWVKKNWLILALVLLVVILLLDKSCDETRYRKNIAKLDDEIAGLETENLKLDGEIQEGIREAKAAEKRVAEAEANIERSQLIIADLQRRRAEVIGRVTTLPPSELVKEVQKILNCAQVQLTAEGVLFSVKCTRTVLVVAREFSLMKKELGETRFSLAESQEALQFQKIATWNVYRIAWAQGSQIINYRTIVEAQDKKFVLCEKQRKKSFWSGLKIGLTVGAGITVTFVIILPAIKAIF